MYDNLKKYMDSKNLKVAKEKVAKEQVAKEKVAKEKVKDFMKLKDAEKWALVEKVLRELGYVE